MSTLTGARATVDALLRTAPYRPDASVEELRASFAERMTRPIPDDVTATTITLGGRPAIELQVHGTTSSTVILYLHGGGFAIGSARTGTHLAAELARRTGARAISLDYRLAPEHPFPAAVDDAVAAYRQLLGDGHAPQRIVLAGDSAGGGLAISALLAVRAAGLPQPAAAVVFSPFADLTLSGPSIDTQDGVDPLFDRAKLHLFTELYRPDGDRAAALASPVFADLSGLPPLLIQVGGHEVLLDDATRLAAHAGRDDVDVRLEVWAGVPHVFQNWTGTLDEAGRALDQAGEFVRDHV